MSHALYAELAAEILHHYARGRRVVGIDGGDPAAATAAGDELGRALAEAGATVVRATRAESAGVVDALVRPFRQGDGDAILVLDGPILGTPAAETLAWSLWLDTAGPGIGGPDIRTSADAILDVTDPDHPIRRFSDWCVIPRR